MTFDPGAFPPPPPPGPPGLPGAPGAVDVLTTDPSGRSSRRWAWVAVGVAVVVLLATAAGAAVAVRWWRGTAPALAAFLPADVTTVAVVDLDPSGQQKVDAIRLLTRLPRDVLDGARDEKQAGSTLVADAISDLTDVPSATVATSAGTWFGGQLAVADSSPGGLFTSSSLADRYLAMTVSDPAAFEQAWAQWHPQPAEKPVGYVVRDGVVVISNSGLADVPSSESASLAATEAFTATAAVREGALAWVWSRGEVATAYPAPGGLQTVTAGLRVRSDGLELAATVRGLTPEVAEAAPPVATGGDVAASISVAPMAEALVSANDAYEWGLDVTDEQVGSLLELLGGSISAAAPVAADGTVGLALDLLGGGQGVAALRADLEAAAAELSEEVGQDAGVDVGGLDPSELLDGLNVDGDDATVRYQVPPGTAASGPGASAAVPDSAAAVQVYVSMPTLLRASGLRESLPADDSSDTMIEAIDTIGVSVAMPEDGRADIAVRVLLLP